LGLNPTDAVVKIPPKLWETPCVGEEPKRLVGFRAEQGGPPSIYPQAPNFFGDPLGIFLPGRGKKMVAKPPR